MEQGEFNFENVLQKILTLALVNLEIELCVMFLFLFAGVPINGLCLQRHSNTLTVLISSWGKKVDAKKISFETNFDHVDSIKVAYDFEICFTYRSSVLFSN